MSHFPIVWANRCTRARHAASTCTACTQACPLQALRIQDDDLHLDAGACTGCGACLAACPMDALSGPEPNDALLMQRVQQAAQTESAQLTVRCQVAEHSDASRTSTVLKVPCLLRVRASDLRWMRTQGVQRIVLEHGPCADCGAQFAQHVRALTEAVADVAETHEVSKQYLASRRAFFGRWLRQTQAKEPIHETHHTQTVDVQARFVPESLARARTAQLPAHGLQVKEGTCIGCGVCAAVCPTSALEVQADAQLWALTLDQTRCAGCKLCVDVCFRHALQPVQTLLAQCVTLVERRTDTHMFDTFEGKLQSMLGEVPVHRT